MNQSNITESLNRIEAVIGELKSDRGELKSASWQLADASKKFVEQPNLKSAKVFLHELDGESRTVPTIRAAAWTTVTVTIVTILSDDQGN